MSAARTFGKSNVQISVGKSSLCRRGGQTDWGGGDGGKPYGTYTHFVDFYDKGKRSREREKKRR